MDRSKLEILKHRLTVGGERTYDQVKSMSFRPGETEIGCDKTSVFCTAAVEVLPGLVAIWTVWSSQRTGVAAGQIAASQGAALVQFARRAIGPVEDETLVAEE